MNMAESISNKLSYFNALDHLRHVSTHATNNLFASSVTPGGRGGYFSKLLEGLPPKFWWECATQFSKHSTLTLFQTKICNFLAPIFRPRL